MLEARSLQGTKLVIFDAHPGLKVAIAALDLSAAWQRCRGKSMRNVLTRVPKASQEKVTTAVRTVFAKPDAEHVRRQLDVIATMLGRQSDETKLIQREGTDGVTAFIDFPPWHWKEIRSTNQLVRVHKQIECRTDVVGVFLNTTAPLRRVGAVLIEMHDKWQTCERRYMSEETMN